LAVQSEDKKMYIFLDVLQRNDNYRQAVAAEILPQKKYLNVLLDPETNLSKFGYHHTTQMSSMVATG
jgi:hypothetical protein